MVFVSIETCVFTEIYVGTHVSTSLKNIYLYYLWKLRCFFVLIQEERFFFFENILKINRFN